MSIIFWINLWKVTFILGILVFIVMAIWVTIIGFKDIKILLSNQRKKEGN